MNQAHSGREEGFQSNSTACGLFKGQAFAFFILGGVHRTNYIDQARGNSLGNRKAVFLFAQRWLDLKECAVICHVQRVQR